MDAGAGNNEFLTIDELAALLKLKKSWIYGETCKGANSLVPFFHVGKHLRFERSRVLEALGVGKNTTCNGSPASLHS